MRLIWCRKNLKMIQSFFSRQIPSLLRTPVIVRGVKPYVLHDFMLQVFLPLSLPSHQKFFLHVFGRSQCCHLFISSYCCNISQEKDTLWVKYGYWFIRCWTEKVNIVALSEVANGGICKTKCENNPPGNSINDSEKHPIKSKMEKRSHNRIRSSISVKKLFLFDRSCMLLKLSST